MNDYTILVFDIDGRISEKYQETCASDDVVVARCRAFIDDASFEIWCGSRLVERVMSKREE